MNRIITQKPLPWWPKITMLYNKGSELRDLFLKTLTYVTQGCMSHNPVRMMPSFNLRERVYPLRFARATEEGHFQRNLLLCIVKLINADPVLMLHHQDKTGHEIQSATMELINGLVSLMHQDTLNDVATCAMEALLTLHHPDKIEMWNPEAPVPTFWDVSSHVSVHSKFSAACSRRPFICCRCRHCSRYRKNLCNITS